MLFQCPNIFLYFRLTMDAFEKHTPFAEQSPPSPQLSDFTVTFSRTHCWPHSSETTATKHKRISHHIIRLIAAHHHLCLASVAESVAISLLSLITTTTPNPGTQLPHSTGAVSHSERAELIKIGYAIRSLRMVAACDYNDDEQNKTTYRSAD